jgi:hypothetical protein
MVESMPNETSESHDAVLGGDRPAPLTGLVLGGLSGLQQQFGTQDIGVQIAALVNAVDFGDEAISLLLQGLNSEVLQIRGIAYDLLKQIGSPAAIAAAGEGVPLKVGDRVYAVYRSSLSYGDDWYSINGSINEWYLEYHPIYRLSKDSAGQDFVYITDEQIKREYNFNEDDYDYDEFEYCPQILQFFLVQSAAKAFAEKEHKQEFFNMSAEFIMIERDVDYEEDEEDGSRRYIVGRINLEDWCRHNRIEFSRRENEDLWYAESRLLKQLKDQKQADLLYDLWSQIGYEPLVFVHEYTIDRPCYLRLSK